MEAPIYNTKGTKAGTINLADELFALPWNADLVHQVVVGMQANARTPVAHSKDRSEVSGTNQKPWRQKGTGRARHGQRISPIWRGGGVAHGPRNERVYAQKINKKMRTKAFFTVLSQKLKDGEIFFVEDLAMAEPKTKEATATLKSLAQADGLAQLSTKRKNAALIALPTYDETTAKGYRNIESVFVEEVRNLNPVQLLNYKYLIIARPEESLKVLTDRSLVKKGAKN